MITITFSGAKACVQQAQYKHSCPLYAVCLYVSSVKTWKVIKKVKEFDSDIKG